MNDYDVIFKMVTKVMVGNDLMSDLQYWKKYGGYVISLDINKNEIDFIFNDNKELEDINIYNWNEEE